MSAQNETVLITGASRGIGEATARHLAESGHKIYLASRSHEELEKIAEEIEACGGRAAALELDLQNEASIEACGQRLKGKKQPPTILINNAGFGIYGQIEDVPLEQVRELFETNYFGAVKMIRELLPVLKKADPGRIINVASGVAKRGFPVMSHYAASKAALESISESLRWELKPEGIVVQIVYPLRTETGFSAAARRFVPDNFSFPTDGPTQTSEAVARAISGGLKTDKFRIHPHYSTRFLGVLNELFPNFVGRLLGFEATVEASGEE